MAAPNALPSAGPPLAAAVPPPPEQLSPPPSQLNATSSPTSSPLHASPPPPQSPTPPVEPPPPPLLDLRPPLREPPQNSPLTPSHPPPMTSHPPPEPPQNSPPPPSKPETTPHPPPMSSHPPPEPPQNSPPPPSKPETTSHPPPKSSHPPPKPPQNPPPPPSKPETTSHPSPLAKPPKSSHPPQKSPPPPSKPATTSHPPPLPNPPKSSHSPPITPPPPSKPPKDSHSTPSPTPPSPPTLQVPSSNPTPNSPPPPPSPSPSPSPSSSPPPPTPTTTTIQIPPPLPPPNTGDNGGINTKNVVVIGIVPPSPSDTITNNNSNSNSPQTTNTNRNLSAGSIVAIGVVLGFVLLTVLVATAWCLKRRKKKNSALLHDSAFSKVHMSSPLIGFGSSTGSAYAPTDFDFEELFKATNGFSELNLLGEGGFGSVYKGNLPDGIEIAVKKLKIGGGQGEREFKAEVEIISRIHHRHLVSLVGYCISGDQRLLVYEYIPNNSLCFHLHGEGRPVMDWAMRVKVAVGATRGIAYLHQDCNPRVIHRDIKSSNILLDTNFQARVCDFGLAKLALDANTHLTTRVMGTFGYLAPEYAFSGQLTDKSDVYSFGVVLLELITGRKSVDSSQPMGDMSLVEWAKPLLSHALDTKEIEGLVDPRLEKNYVHSEMFLMIEAASACIRHSAKKRPQMRQIVTAFDSIATLDLTNGMKVGHSEVYNSAEKSAEIKLFRTIAFGSRDSSSDTLSQSSSNMY